MLLLACLVAAVAAVRGLWSPCGMSMLSSINPVAERARGNRFWLTACWYVAGAMLGGLALGAACAVGALAVRVLGMPHAGTWAVAAVFALVGVVSDTGVLGRSLPVHPRQVDERWLTRYRRWIYAAGFGVQIGAGFTTYIMSAAVYLTAGLAVLTGSPRAALLIGLVFGAVRGLTIAASAFTRTPEALRALHRRLAAAERASLALAIAAQAGAAVAAATAAGPALLAVVGAALAATALYPLFAGARRRLRQPAGQT
jgi:hypothetical protein